MNLYCELVAERELLVMELQIQRQLLAGFSVFLVAERPVDARSATMRFILGRPQLCLWAAGQIIPYLISKIPGKSAKRFARALQADR